MSEQNDSKTGPPNEQADEQTVAGKRRSLADWRRLWEGDETFPISSRRGWLGKPVVWLKKALRGIVRAPQADLWERQRAYNLRLQEHMEESAERLRVLEEGMAARLDQLGKDLQTIQGELARDVRILRKDAEDERQKVYDAAAKEIYELRDSHFEYLEAHEKRIERIEGLYNRGWDDSMDHTTALFARLDQKLDRYRSLSRERWSRLGALLEVAKSGGPEALGDAVADASYVEFEAQFRGREEDIGQRLAPYLPILEGRGEVLDLGCGRGEALAVLSEAGIPCSGVDSNSEMIERCREKGLTAEVGDLYQALAARPEGSLGAVVSFHVIEHLPAATLEGLVRSAWLALKPGGVLILETPSPLSLVVAARNFWLDPTHLRPVHPDSLKAVFQIAGFDPVERIDLQPFPPEERLPEVSSADLPEELHPVVDRMAALRDQVDALLFGFQDFGLVGYKPE